MGWSEQRKQSAQQQAAPLIRISTTSSYARPDLLKNQVSEAPPESTAWA